MPPIRIAKNSIKQCRNGAGWMRPGLRTRLRPGIAPASVPGRAARPGEPSHRAAGSLRQAGRPDGRDDGKEERKAPPPRSNKNWVPWVVVGALGLIVLIAVLAAARPKRKAPMRYAALGYSRPRPEKPPPLRPMAELGGKTMAEWESQHNTNNLVLEARRQRLDIYRSGSVPEQPQYGQ